MTGALLALALVAGLVVALIGFAPDAFGEEHNRMALVYFLCLLVLVGGGTFATLRSQWRESLRNAAIWTLILVVLVAGYSIRGEISDLGRGMLAALAPGLAVSGAPNQASLRRGRDGHFYAWAKVDGADIRFVVDTGATSIALTSRDARSIGLDVDRLDFIGTVSTANGTTTVAPVKLDAVEIGGIEIRDVDAAVLRAGQLETSLLGLSFLGRLSAYSFEGDTLVLRR